MPMRLGMRAVSGSRADGAITVPVLPQSSDRGWDPGRSRQEPLNHGNGFIAVDVDAVGERPTVGVLFRVLAGWAGALLRRERPELAMSASGLATRVFGVGETLANSVADVDRAVGESSGVQQLKVEADAPG